MVVEGAKWLLGKEMKTEALKKKIKRMEKGKGLMEINDLKRLKNGLKPIFKG